MSVTESAHTHSRGSSAGGVDFAAAPAAAAAAASPPPPPPPSPVPATLASERGISVFVSGTVRGLSAASRLSSAIVSRASRFLHSTVNGRRSSAEKVARHRPSSMHESPQ
eukprot:scaffold87295_cov61-Phaeocystis_antarctica.AAC.1